MNFLHQSGLAFCPPFSRSLWHHCEEGVDSPRRMAASCEAVARAGVGVNRSAVNYEHCAN